MDAPFVPACDGLNVSAQQIGRVLWSRHGFEPFGIVLVPAEIMAARYHAVRFGKGHERIGLREIEAVLFRLRRAPFHGVFGHNDGALLKEESREFGTVKLAVGDRRAEEEAFRGSDFAERGKRLRGGEARKRTSGEGR